MAIEVFYLIVNVDEELNEDCRKIMSNKDRYVMEYRDIFEESKCSEGCRKVKAYSHCTEMMSKKRYRWALKDEMIQGDREGIVRVEWKSFWVRDSKREGGVNWG